MDFDSVRPLISGAIGGLIAVGIGYVVRKQKPTKIDDGVELRYGLPLKLLSWVLFPVFGFFAVYNSIHGSAVNSYIVAVSVPSVLAAVAGYLVLETTFVSVVLGASSISCRSIWRRKRVIDWREVTQYSNTNSGYALRTRASGTVHISSHMRGADAVEAYLGRNHIPLK